MNTIEQFQAYLLSRDKSPKTIQGYGADLKWLLIHSFISLQ